MKPQPKQKTPPRRTTPKTLSISFCPKCRSKDVGWKFGFWNAFGILPRMHCRKCGFEGGTFPLLVVDKNKLEKLNKKMKGKK